MKLWIPLVLLGLCVCCDAGVAGVRLCYAILNTFSFFLRVELFGCPRVFFVLFASTDTELDRGEIRMEELYAEISINVYFRSPLGPVRNHR